MFENRVKLPKQALPSGSLGEFTQIARFARPQSSLYQALGVGIMEIMIRFKHNPSNLTSLNLLFSHQMRKTEEFSRNLNINPEFLATFNQLISLVTNTDIISGLNLLNHYTQNDTSLCLSLDYATRLLICSTIEGKTEVQNKIMEEKPLDSLELLLNGLATSLEIKISLFENGQETKFFKNQHGVFPSLNLIKEGNSYGILYADKMIEIETNQRFNPSDVEGHPFCFLID